MRTWERNKTDKGTCRKTDRQRAMRGLRLGEKETEIALGWCVSAASDSSR